LCAISQIRQQIYINIPRQKHWQCTHTVCVAVTARCSVIIIIISTTVVIGAWRRCFFDFWRLVLIQIHKTMHNSKLSFSNSLFNSDNCQVAASSFSMFFVNCFFYVLLQLCINLCARCEYMFSCFYVLWTFWSESYPL